MEHYCRFCERKTLHRLEGGKLVCRECMPADKT